MASRRDLEGVVGPVFRGLARNGILRVLMGMMALLPMGLQAQTAWWQGSKTVSLITRDDERLPVGTLNLEPQGDGSILYRLTMDASRFTDHFLSMKEFKCVGGQPELMCHVAYPYPNPRRIRPGQLAWLEHDLLFLFKLPGEFGAKLWNGLYFELRPSDAGLEGRAQAIDLNHISAPPDQPAIPPYRRSLREEVPVGQRWIKGISIQ